MKNFKIFFYAFAAIILYALADYFAYNLWGRELSYDIDKNMLIINPFRIIMFALVIAITVFFWKKWNIFAAGSFFYLWWFGVADLAYYAFFDCLKIFGGEYAGQAFTSEVLGNLVTWLYFTPCGLYLALTTGTWDSVLSGTVILIQAGVGVLLSVLFAALAWGTDVNLYD